MMTGEIQEPFNLNLLENSIHSGSVSFGRFEKEALSWEKRSSFSYNRYLEEAEKFTKPGSVTLMRAHFEAHFKTKGIRFPTCLQTQTCGKLVHHHNNQTSTEKDENLLWESTSLCSLYSYEQDKFDQERSQFGDSCASYQENLVISDDDRSSLSVALEKIEVCSNERTLEDVRETTSSSETRSKPLKLVKKASHCSAPAKASTRNPIVITKGSPSCIDTKRQKDLKLKRNAKAIASQTTTTKKSENPTPLVATNRYKHGIDSATREKITTTSNLCSISNKQPQKKKEVEVVVRKALNFKARPMPKSTQGRPQHASTGQAKARDDAQEHSSKASRDRSLKDGVANSKININKNKVDEHRSLNRIVTKSSDQTARKNV